MTDEQMQPVTIDQVMAWGPCYSRAKILEMASGRKELAIDEIKALDLTGGDMAWILG